MLDKEVAQYFQSRDQNNPKAKQNRRYFRLMFSITEGLFRMRKRVGLTQYELADRLQTTQSTIARWESAGYTGYTLRKLFDIAEQLGYALNISFEEILPTSTFDQSIELDWGNSRIISRRLIRCSLGVQVVSSRQETIYKEIGNGQTHMVPSL